jgi:ATP-binding cassette subfamily B protein
VRAARVRDIGVRIADQPLGLLRGAHPRRLARDRHGLRLRRPHGRERQSLTVGTLLALTALLARLYGPLTAISNVRVDIMTALVSFERVFEVLDLEPLVAEAPTPVAVPRARSAWSSTTSGFSYPSADEVSLASLESTATGDRRGRVRCCERSSFVTANPGQLVALVGPSGAGKTTITSLVARLYDPTAGAIRINGVDLREADERTRCTMPSASSPRRPTSSTTPSAANLAYAARGHRGRDASPPWRPPRCCTLVESLPSGLDTVVGDRGHRLSGGEKQRLAIARLLLKGPGLVVLDEATAHLDSESEVALQRALDEALRDRSRLGDRAPPVDDAGCRPDPRRRRRTHRRARHAHRTARARGPVYADLYRTQFDDEPWSDGLTKPRLTTTSGPPASGRRPQSTSRPASPSRLRPRTNTGPAS